MKFSIGTFGSKVVYFDGRHFDVHGAATLIAKSL